VCALTQLNWIKRLYVGGACRVMIETRTAFQLLPSHHFFLCLRIDYAMHVRYHNWPSRVVGARGWTLTLRSNCCAIVYRWKKNKKRGLYACNWFFCIGCIYFIVDGATAGAFVVFESKKSFVVEFCNSITSCHAGQHTSWHVCRTTTENWSVHRIDRPFEKN